ncbi:hypothetical protein EYF80_025103 [Liparis tanakae]|uniref:Uncharacterized protein n=1 Tax=Liparis tanakae TaxID=230148 RepID=A0A4Z2HG43_9TELE|nr:hypothetical protein EYF80_025103 [Liparis tanakae]
MTWGGQGISSEGRRGGVEEEDEWQGLLAEMALWSVLAVLGPTTELHQEAQHCERPRECLCLWSLIPSLLSLLYRRQQGARRPSHERPLSSDACPGQGTLLPPYFTESGTLLHDITMTTMVAWGAVSEGTTVLAEVSRVNQRHHVLVPGLGSCALIRRGGPGSKQTIG